MLVEFKLSGDLISFNYNNPNLEYYNSVKNIIVKNYSCNKNTEWYNCIFDKPYFQIRNRCVEEIIVPCSPKFELYYLSQNGHFYFFDDYTKAIEKLENPKIDKKQLNSFHSKMTCTTGNTFHYGIKRLIPGKKYYLKNNILVFENYMPINGLNLSYNEFKMRFEGYVKNLTENKNVGLLLSGGVDSTAVALAASKFSKSLRTYTMRYNPLQSGTEKDAIIAKKTSDDNNWIHKVVDIDFTSDLKQLIGLYSNKIPLVCGLPNGYNRLLEVMQCDDIEIAITGQNADLLTYFGATAKFKFNREGLVAFTRRLLFSKYYYYYLDKKAPRINRLFSSGIYFFGHIICLSYSIYKKTKYRQPKTLYELFSHSRANPDSLPFIKKNENHENPRPALIYDELNARNFHYFLLRERIGEDMMLSDSQLIKVAGKFNDINVDFPYSSNSLVYFFLNREFGLKSLFEAKFFINKYVRDNYPEYSKRVKIKTKEESLSPHQWARFLLNSGNIPVTKDVSGVRTPFGELYFQISKMWFDNFREKQIER